MDESTALLGGTASDWVDINQMDSMLGSTTQLKVDRPVFPQSTIDETYKCKTHRPYFFDIRCFSCKCKQNPFFTLFPALSWLSNYRWQQDLIKDMIAGFTVGIMNIPQGMAYAILGNVPPVIGLYMAFFPVLVYALLGTSKHISMGTFAVVSLMAGKTVATFSSPHVEFFENINATTTDHLIPVYSPVEVAAAVTFMVGIFQLVMYLLRLGVIATLLSDTLVSGLTAGAAVHVFTSQINDLIGVKYPKSTGAFPIIYAYIGIFNNLDTISMSATLMSAITIIILVINNEILKPRLSNISVIPIPIELIAVLTGTLLSRYLDISELYGLTTVGPIAVGLPEAHIPRFSLLSSVAIDSFVIAIIAYIISISMALIFSQKLQYELDPNQELLAQGTGNLVGSFFSCLPFSASLSRSVIQETAGGQTQLASVFSSGIILVVLLWIAPFFEPLPRCILASLIVVALKGILFQVKDVFRIWKMSRLDGIIWLSTYLAVILIEIDIGLLVGLFVSILMIFIQGMKPYTCRLARLPNTEIYVDSARYSKTEEVPGVCVIHYAGGLNFANRNYFKSAIHQILNDYHHNIKGDKITEKMKEITVSIVELPEMSQIKFLVLNLSALQYVDPTGSLALLSLAKELVNIPIKILLSGVTGPVHDTLKSCKIFDSGLFTCFPTIHDAVLFAQSRLQETTHNERL
ncbi:solute carrier family 26 member prestin isoform X2 [Lycorma delicatula]|uniref:solute carrier family 26 member prestin isoform X2 n=1 Tax=Lycorma delicatula TaxID=130591 RepID=UPI003F511B56